MNTATFALTFLALGANTLAADCVLELRGSSTSYRYTDVMCTNNRLAVDGFYVGVPGNNEANIGLGYQWKVGNLTLIPMLYATTGKEEGWRGIKTAIIPSWENKGYKVGVFLARYQRLAGGSSNY